VSPFEKGGIEGGLEGWGRFFIKIKIPLASPFEKGRNYFKSPFVPLCHFPSFPSYKDRMQKEVKKGIGKEIYKNGEIEKEEIFVLNFQ